MKKTELVKEDEQTVWRLRECLRDMKMVDGITESAETPTGKTDQDPLGELRDIFKKAVFVETGDHRRKE